MQKKLIALAIAGLASSAAFAADNVTVYGRMDYGYQTRDGSSGLVQGVQRKGELTSGLEAGSRIGFKGSEALGNGLTAIFEAEFGLAIDAPSLSATGAANVNQASAAYFTNRHSYVGLTGGFGTAVGGRLDGVRYGLFNKYDAFAGGGMGNFTQMTTQYDRADNAIAYISPNFSGFTLTLAHSTNTGGLEGNVGAKNTQVGAPSGVAGKPVGNMGDDVLYTIMGNYSNGPIDISLDYETTTQKDVSGDTRLHVATLGGSYDFGVVKLSALYDEIKGDKNSNIGTYDKRNYFVSARAPIAGSKFVVKATYGKVKDKITSDADANKFGLGVDYVLSKRTNFYADYGHIGNSSKAGYAVNAAANSGGAGYGVNGFDIGIAHSF